MKKTLTAVLVGAGLRGITYTDIMKELDDKYKVIAVAEPIESRRNYIKEKHNIDDKLCFKDYNDLLACNMEGALYIQMLNNYLELINTMKSNLGKMLNISNTLINAYELYCEVSNDVQ